MEFENGLNFVSQDLTASFHACVNVEKKEAKKRRKWKRDDSFFSPAESSGVGIEIGKLDAVRNSPAKIGRHE